MIVSFHRLAEQELNEAAQYYERESPGLGAAFLAEAQRCCDAILEYPESGQVAVGAVRRRLLRRFPYALLYTIPPNAIRISGDEPEAASGLLGRPFVDDRSFGPREVRGSRRPPTSGSP